MRPQHFPVEKRRQGGHIVVAFPFFPIIDAGRMIATDPLTPAVEPELLVEFLPGQVRVPDEPHMRGTATVRQRPRQAGNATGNPAGAGIRIGPFKGE